MGEYAVHPNEPANAEIGDRMDRWHVSRDPAALGEMLKSQRDRAYATALGILGNAADAEDAVQDAFLKLLSRRSDYRNAEDFRIAVYCAVTRCSLDLDRSQNARAKREEIMRATKSHADPAPEPAIEHAERLVAVREEMALLPDEDRAAVVLCGQEGLSASAAAEALAVNPRTLRHRLTRAMTSLQARLRKRDAALGSAALLALLHENGAPRAPETLIHALDAALPGAPCAAVPAAAIPATSAWASAGISSTWATALALSAGAGVLAVATVMWALHDPASKPPAPKAEIVAAQPVLPLKQTPEPDLADRETISTQENTVILHKTEKEEPMKKVVAAVVLGAASIVGTTFAGDVDAPKVADLVKEIKAYREAKAEQAAKEVRNYQRTGTEWGVKSGQLMPGGAVIVKE